MGTTGDSATERVGDAERGRAIQILNEHWKEGRLDPSEHEARTTKAHGAIMRQDLDQLFTDLPARSPTGGVVEPASPAAPSPSHGGGLFPADSWIARRRHAIMRVTPIAATALFFTTGNHWQWFLAIPAVGAALYAGDEGRDHRKAGRRKDRDERRRLGRDTD